ncbi:MAG: hypothetical protein GX817_01740 [Elusimicrobia bacterium]|nr:hypothetical protein [Elusimicrobiota bacterium]
MNKKLLVLFFCLAAIPAQATVAYKTVWDADEEILSITDNYGTPLSENIRMDLQRKKGYYYFNLMKARSATSPLSLNLQSEGWEGLPEELTASRKSLIENFKPIVDEGRLFHLRWDSGLLELRTEDFPVYRSDKAFKFLGKRADNILISRDGRLEWLDEMNWEPVSPLQGYVASYVRWIDDNTIFLHVERESDGRRQIVISSVRRPSALFLPLPPGEFVEGTSSADKNRIFALSKDADKWSIYCYSSLDDEWSQVWEFDNRVYLLDIPGETLVWFNPEKSRLESLNSSIKLTGFEELPMYSEGKYLCGEAGCDLYEVAPLVQRALYYPSSAKKAISEIGFSEFSIHGADGDIWLLPDKYRGTLQRLSKKSPGQVYLSSEDMNIYYDTDRSGLRQIKTLRVRPSSPGKFILFILSALLLLLVINAVRRSVGSSNK